MLRANSSNVILPTFVHVLHNICFAICGKCFRNLSCPVSYTALLIPDGLAVNNVFWQVELINHAQGNGPAAWLAVVHFPFDEESLHSILDLMAINPSTLEIGVSSMSRKKMSHPQVRDRYSCDSSYVMILGCIKSARIHCRKHDT